MAAVGRHNTQATGGKYVLPIDDNGQCHLGHYLLRQLDRYASLLLPDQKNGKFIAAHPGEYVAFSDASLDSPRHLRKQEIPRAVPQAIVDELEAIEVQKQHGSGRGLSVTGLIEHP